MSELKREVDQLHQARIAGLQQRARLNRKMRLVLTLAEILLALLIAQKVALMAIEAGLVRYPAIDACTDEAPGAGWKS